MVVKLVGYILRFRLQLAPEQDSQNDSCLALICPQPSVKYLHRSAPHETTTPKSLLLVRLTDNRAACLSVVYTPHSCLITRRIGNRLGVTGAHYYCLCLQFRAQLFERRLALKGGQILTRFLFLFIKSILLDNFHYFFFRVSNHHIVGKEI